MSLSTPTPIPDLPSELLHFRDPVPVPLRKEGGIVVDWTHRNFFPFQGKAGSFCPPELAKRIAATGVKHFLRLTDPYSRIWVYFAEVDTWTLYHHHAEPLIAPTRPVVPAWSRVEMATIVDPEAYGEPYYAKPEKHTAREWAEALLAKSERMAAQAAWERSIKPVTRLPEFGC